MTKTILREILSLPFFDRLQNEAGYKFGANAVRLSRYTIKKTTTGTSRG
jgi:hypothetical protein